tara:strand:- start:518 stop:937 length:420 start_codon:yes stop_codon:yes gene_type:complete
MDNQLKNNLEDGFEKLFNSKVIIKKQRKNQALKKKALFMSLITQYERSIAKSTKLRVEFSIDLFEYEEPFYSIMDKLMLLTWGDKIYELVSFYLYERENLDGTLNFLVEINGDEETEVFLETPEELYQYLLKIDSNFLN